ncbi:serum amyloid P-component-like [Lampris incognitus]|uniref:serum amyloid P-component-like n=1 Tax=Lampris incognitus TaxID=2546036 RepID=UPI0024B55F14|nr:serum amyloid P-component-like [Lampris incognitus]
MLSISFSALLPHFSIMVKGHQLLFFFILCLCSLAVSQGLSHKQVTFPDGPDAPRVVLHTSVQKISAMTLCQRFFSDLPRYQSLFSLATRQNSNAVLLGRESAGSYSMYLGSARYVISGLPEKQFEWNSICWTWSTNTGLSQVWLNGKRTVQKRLTASVLTGDLSIILGQEQDSFGGAFDSKQSFEGDITDVHVWDSVLPACQISSYMNGIISTPGNILNWEALKYDIVGSVFVQESDFFCFS